MWAHLSGSRQLPHVRRSGDSLHQPLHTGIARISPSASLTNMSRNQTQDAQELYDSRASVYDDSHHPRFARHMTELAKLQPGESVLDLACGTGLVSFSASEAVGPDGRVVGVDLSEGMLAQAKAKKIGHSLRDVEFYLHSITELNTLPVLQEQTFDVITCCSALVLLEHPIEALIEWTKYLKPGGRLVVDVTHIQNLTPGIVMERVGRRMGRPLPWYRLNFPSDDSLRQAMERAGLIKVNVTFLSQIMDSGPEGSQDLKDYLQDVDHPRILKEYSIEDADAVFDAQIEGVPTKVIASPSEVRHRARELFREEWEKAADADGKVREVDGIFVGVGFKP